MSNHFIMFIAGFLGIFLHLLVKVNQINKKLSTVNYKMVFQQYWKTDWTVVLLSIVAVITAIFISNEWLNIKDSDKTPGNLYEILQFKIVQFVRTVFVVLGYCADSVIAAYLSGTEQKLIQKAKDAGVPVEQIFNQTKS